MTTRRDGLSLLYDLFAASSAARELLAPVMAPTGLTAEQYAFYSVLRTHGPMTLTEFAETCHLPLTTASDHARAMEQRTHVARRRNPGDGRSWLLELTADGAAAHERAREAFTAAARLVRRRLSLPEPEVRQALHAVEQACVLAATPPSSDREDEESSDREDEESSDREDEESSDREDEESSQTPDTTNP